MGLETVKLAAKQGFSRIAIEAGQSLLLDKEALRLREPMLQISSSWAYSWHVSHLSPHVLCVPCAGEPSGDALGARLMEGLKEISPNDIEFHGVGGQKMASQGITSLFPMSDIALMGILKFTSSAKTFGPSS